MSPSHADLPEELPEPSSGGCRATREILDRLGDKWALYVIAKLASGTRRFNELRREIDGISQRMLTLTLRAMERDGLVTRTIYPTIPPRVDYDLTELGRTLFGPVMALVNWANDNQFAIAEAHRRFDETPERGTIPVQGVVHQRR